MILPELRQDARFHISPQLTADEYSDDLLNKNINRWYQKILSWIIPIQGEWEINGDILTLDLEEGVTDYEIPVTFLRIYKAEIKYKNEGGGFVPLTQVSIQRYQEVASGNEDPFSWSAANPSLEVFGDYFQISPAPHEDVQNGLKIWAQFSFSELNETIDLPDLPEPVHRILAYGPALDYCLAQEMWTKANEIKRMIYGDSRVPDDKGLKGEIEAMYSVRTGDRRDRFVATRRSYR